MFKKTENFNVTETEDMKLLRRVTGYVALKETKSEVMDL
jgi:hypothetical protein